MFSTDVEVRAGGSGQHMPSLNDLANKTFDQLTHSGSSLADRYPLKTIQETQE